MSMLAEPRRKQKWSVDPRNSAWSNDESKFGQKMLERMGWSKGKGLGKTEQGATEHIKVKVKNNNLGLGTAMNNEDNWIAHQDDFNQLLAELNNCHGQNGNDYPTQEQGFSLEEKSKTSKKRVHYMKFTKGKDLSSRSETDLACIFGKRSKRETRDQDEGSSGADSQEEKEEDTETNPNPETNLNTVTSTLTMQEYFAQRMAQLKKAQAGRDPTGCSSEVSSNVPSPLATSASMDDSPNTSDMEQSKKKKKKKKDRDSNRDDIQEDALTSVTGETVEEPNHSQKKKKKNKRKREERDEEGTEVCSATEEDAPTTGKRKKEKKTSLEVHADEVETIEIENMYPKVSDKKKKKKKRQQEKEEGAAEEGVPKKNKKK
ncbi:PIN2/TERF1-interacting telomerase inhibitor 1 [Labeo rohita]|uniref:PIN2/TERF1-interacting telomerase inhibitor 1 n=1 Tax=Labeo rohita TaxID=84645 RepID=UPI0021E2FB1B|nr:PIN2/TERF1-interacting telomerase inhibitor 1 [Labeo rohita]